MSVAKPDRAGKTGVPVVATVTPYSEGHDFAGAVAVLSNLGDTAAPCRVIAAPARSLAGPRCDLAGLRRLHRAAVKSRRMQRL